MPRLMDLVTDEPAAYEFMEQMRWGTKALCPHCHSENVRYIQPHNGTSRLTRTGSVSKRRVWKCRDCKKQFSVLTGTVFHGTKIPVRTWVFVIFEMCASKNGVSAREIERKYGVTNKTAWFMLHRIREAMGSGTFTTMGGNGATIVADRTFVGGSVSSMHESKVNKPTPLRRALRRREDRPPVPHRYPVPRGPLPGRPRRHLSHPPQGHRRARRHGRLHPPHRRSHAVQAIGTEFALHESVNHSQDEYVRGTVTTNHVEGFFSQLKRSLDGTHHQISRKHLHRYLGEFDYRYTTRRLSDTKRFALLLSRVAGVRLTYRPLIGG